MSVNQDRFPTDKIVIQTHSNRFHCDELIAVALLNKHYTENGYSVSVLRSRDSEKFKTSDILVDVGMEYNPATHRFDHHQKNCNEKWENSEIPLSSVGLIWRHYGAQIMSSYLRTNFEDEYDNQTITELVNRIYFKLIIDIDANDNGVTYNSTNLNLPSIVSAMNGDTSDDESQDTQFQKAMLLVSEIFSIKVKEIVNSYFSFQKDLEVTKKLIDEVDFIRVNEGKDIKYLVLSKDVPTIYKCLGKLDPDYRIVFLIVSNETNKEYSVKARRPFGERYTSLCPIAPQEELSKHLPVEDIVFVHKGLFIAKFKTLESAIKAVEISLEYKNNIEEQKESAQKKENCSDLVEQEVRVISTTKVDKRVLIGVGLLGAIGGYIYWKNSN